MVWQSSLCFTPKRVFGIGAAFLGAGFLLVLPILVGMGVNEAPSYGKIRREEVSRAPLKYDVSLGAKTDAFSLPIPSLEGELSFSFDPPRPKSRGKKNALLVRLNKSSLCKKVRVPGRADLTFEKGMLKFSEKPSPFWLDLAVASGAVEGKLVIESLEGAPIHSQAFTSPIQESPLRSSKEFAKNSPFYSLAEACWLGQDQFLSEGAAVERIDIGGNRVEIQAGQWLTFKDGAWRCVEKFEKTDPIVEIESISPKGLILKGWGDEGFVRVQLCPAKGLGLSFKPEELFQSIRVRSEKQISCTLDKQCMVLKVSDWVLKLDGKWKVLRQDQERSAFRTGSLKGELFILDAISEKQGQKIVQGRIFNQSRTQVTHVELKPQANSRRSSRKGSL